KPVNTGVDSGAVPLLSQHAADRFEALLPARHMSSPFERGASGSYGQRRAEPQLSLVSILLFFLAKCLPVRAVGSSVMLGIFTQRSTCVRLRSVHHATASIDRSRI